MNSISLVIPLYNEADSVEPLMEAIHAALSNLNYDWEVICVDDGSDDDTGSRIEAARQRYGAHIVQVSLQRNFGQTAAMQAGIDHARGDIVVTLDGDLQNDPADIPRLVERLNEEDLDLLVGWRKDRQDDWLRSLLSRIANRLIGYVTGVRLHDYGCSLKVYRGEVIREVRLFGEMHRFIPAWVALTTSPKRIKEEVVNHHPRRFGQSKYGLSRTFRVIVDLLSVFFFLRFLSRPAHFFGRLGLVFGVLGSAALLYLAYVKILLGQDIGQRPLLMVSILFVVVSIQLFTTGLLGEIVSRTYYSAGDHKPYLVRRRTTSAPQRADWHRPAATKSTPRRRKAESARESGKD